MYEEYLGADYTKKIRQMLTVDEKLLPDRIINAPLNIEGMKQMIKSFVENKTGKYSSITDFVNNGEQYKKLQDASIYYLVGILCVALKSRTSVPPFNEKKYKKPWDKKRENYIKKGNLLMLELLSRKV